MTSKNNNNKKACFLPQPPALFILSTRKAGVVLKPYTPAPKRIGFTAGRVGPKPEASGPILSLPEKGQGREGLAGLSVNWLWVVKLPSMGARSRAVA